MTRRSTPHMDNLESEWIAMSDELDKANDERRKSDELSIQLATERDVLVENMDRMTTELNFWRAYALQIETRLDVILSVISEAKQDAVKRAREDAKASAQPKTDEPKPHPADEYGINHTMLQNVEPRIPPVRY